MGLGKLDNSLGKCSVSLDAWPKAPASETVSSLFPQHQGRRNTLREPFLKGLCLGRVPFVLHWFSKKLCPDVWVGPCDRIGICQGRGWPTAVLIHFGEMSKVSLEPALGRLRPKSWDGLAGTETHVKGNRLHCASPRRGRVALWFRVCSCQFQSVRNPKSLNGRTWALSQSTWFRFLVYAEFCRCIHEFVVKDVQLPQETLRY